MDFELVSDLADVETIASGRGIRELARLRRLYGMKHMASARKNSSARGSSTKPRKSAAAPGRQFAVCVDNEGYEASLERNKIYVVLTDKDAEKNGDLRVIDESGEDYLFSADRFVATDVPEAGKASLLKAS